MELIAQNLLNQKRKRRKDIEEEDLLMGLNSLLFRKFF
jgi:hypothetical protein